MNCSCDVPVTGVSAEGDLVTSSSSSLSSLLSDTTAEIMIFESTTGFGLSKFLFAGLKEPIRAKI